MRNFAERGYKTTHPLGERAITQTPNQTHKTEHNTAFYGRIYRIGAQIPTRVFRLGGGAISPYHHAEKRG